MAKISILLCTCNSGAYLRALVDSILASEYRDFELLVQDDCSEDDTHAILRSYDDPRIRIRVNPSPSGGAAQNFMSALLNWDTGDYIMFADADDYWEPEKIGKTLECMLHTEADCPSGTPVLVHTDLSVVGKDLEPISPSLWEYEKISPERTSFRQLLAQNNVTGCTVMINRALKELVPDAPASFVMHDWWLALCASAFGRIAFLREPLIRYRQHGENSVGAYNAGSLSASAKKLRNRERIERIYRQMFDQAACFGRYYRDRLTPEQADLCRAYAGMKDQTRIGKAYTIIRNGFWKNTLLRNLGQFLAI